MFAVNMLLAPIYLVALIAVVTVALVEMDSYVKVSHSLSKSCLISAWYNVMSSDSSYLPQTHLGD